MNLTEGQSVVGTLSSCLHLILAPPDFEKTEMLSQCVFRAFEAGVAPSRISGAIFTNRELLYRRAPRLYDSLTVQERKSLMARKNRIVLTGRCYHLTTRIAHQAHLLADPSLKDKIVTWMYGIADFSGIDVLDWCIMDNHIHLLVRMNGVPEEYLSSRSPAMASSDRKGTVPDFRVNLPCPAAFSMRPAECRAPRWSPEVGENLPVITPAGDRISAEAIIRANADGVPVVSLPRPPTGFTLTDEQLFPRLERLYDGHSTGAVSIRRRWNWLREHGREDEVEEERDRFCRRMYNISQFMKTFKQRVSEYFNRELGHSGQLWDGRFYSGLVDDGKGVRAVSSYVTCNPLTAGMVADPSDYAWCGYGAAHGDSRWRERARRGFENVYGCSWIEAAGRIAAIIADKLPETYNPVKSRTQYEDIGPDGEVVWRPLRVSQLVKTEVRQFERAAYVSARKNFGAEVRSAMPKGFDTPSDRVLDFFAALDWGDPDRLAA